MSDIDKPTHVSYGYCAWGYEVQVIAGNRIIDSYSGGNSPLESTTRLHPDTPGGVIPVDQLAEYAKQTAIEMAEEVELTADQVLHDPDINTYLEEENQPEIT